MPIVSLLQEGHERQAHAFLRDAWLTSISTPIAAVCPCRLPHAASPPRHTPSGGEALKTMTPQARSEGSQRHMRGGRAWLCPLPILLAMLVVSAAPSRAATHGKSL